jgi:hypothetical protein
LESTRQSEFLMNDTKWSAISPPAIPTSLKNPALALKSTSKGTIVIITFGGNGPKLKLFHRY